MPFNAIWVSVRSSLGSCTPPCTAQINVARTGAIHQIDHTRDWPRRFHRVLAEIGMGAVLADVMDHALSGAPNVTMSRSNKYNAPWSSPAKASLSRILRANASSSICSLTYHCMKLWVV